MYTEFIEGTGCKENEHNYKVYKDLEVMYMNSDLTKQEIYEYGKKLVDNSKSEAEIAFEKEIDEQIVHIKRDIDLNKKRIDSLDWFIKNPDSEFDMIEDWKREKKYLVNENKKYRRKIKELKWVLSV
jgi:hypothetical protein